MSTPEAEARRWMTYARSALDAAQELLQKPDSYPHQVCFLDQQAAEKNPQSRADIRWRQYPSQSI